MLLCSFCCIAASIDGVCDILCGC